MNAGSSRSHLILTLYAHLRSEPDGVEWRGRLHLVDLAGSERVGKSGVTGDQLKEAQHINKSLSALEQVMLVLQGRQGSGDKTHVPYRNSKLTLLLSDALGAKGACAKTIMIMQVGTGEGRVGRRVGSGEGRVRRGGREAVAVISIPPLQSPALRSILRGRYMTVTWLHSIAPISRLEIRPH